MNNPSNEKTKPLSETDSSETAAAPKGLENIPAAEAEDENGIDLIGGFMDYLNGLREVELPPTAADAGGSDVIRPDAEDAEAVDPDAGEAGATPAAPAPEEQPADAGPEARP